MWTAVYINCFALADTSRAEFVGTGQEIWLLTLNKEDSVLRQLRSQRKVFDSELLQAMSPFKKKKYNIQRHKTCYQLRTTASVMNFHY